MPVIVKRPTNRQHASIIQSNLRKKNLELNHAIQYCKENNVRGYAAIAAAIVSELNYSIVNTIPFKMYIIMTN